MHRRRWFAAVVCTAAGLVAAAQQPLATQRLPLDELLFRANQYVVGYQRQISGLIIEEGYTQQVLRHSGLVKQERQLVSDYILVAVAGDSTWREFRDVFEVDGQAVGDRQARLTDLFLNPVTGAERQVRKIVAASARYNIGEISRNFNVPTMALAFLDPINQHRFHFEDIGEETFDGEALRVVRFVELNRPTFVQIPPTGRGVPVAVFSHGRFWLSPSDGRVVQSEFIAGDEKVGVRATITVLYQREPTLGLWLPARMTERYDNPRLAEADVIAGVATYRRYRKFFANTDFTVK